MFSESLSLPNASFYGVRLAASRAIRAIQTDEALAALRASTKQSDARVRRQVVTDIAGFYREASYEALRKIVDEEKNPDIQAVAITALGAYARPEVRATLLQFLDSTSYRNTLADAAISAMRAQDDAGYIEPLLGVLRKKETAFTTAGFARALDTLAYLARHEEKKQAAREFLLGQVNSPKKRVQLAALAALGLLGDAAAIAPLETFTSAPKESAERLAAEKSIASLREARKPSVEMGAMRNEVLGLQKENRELRREFDEMKKKLEAAGKPDAAKGKAGSATKLPKR